MMRDAGANTPEENRQDPSDWTVCPTGYGSPHLPSVGLGVALGGGAGPACLDHVIATPNVKQPSEGKLGIPPAVMVRMSIADWVQHVSADSLCRQVE